MSRAGRKKKENYPRRTGVTSFSNPVYFLESISSLILFEFISVFFIQCVPSLFLIIILFPCLPSLGNSWPGCKVQNIVNGQITTRWVCKFYTECFLQTQNTLRSPIKLLVWFRLTVRFFLLFSFLVKILWFC